jgi:hypothetical protein
MVLQLSPLILTQFHELNVSLGGNQITRQLEVPTGSAWQSEKKPRDKKMATQRALIPINCKFMSKTIYSNFP